MKLIDAIAILQPKSGKIEDLTAAFTENKDRDGAEDAFNMLWNCGEVAINRALIRDNVLDEMKTNELKAKQDERNKQIQDHIETIIDKIKDIEGVKAEVCGSWLWVDGETKAHANSLKAAGLKWARKKKKWYWRPEGGRKRKSGKPWEMNKIRERYGSEEIAA